LDTLLAWLTGLSPITLYVVLGSLALIENIFPPAPSDTIIAFGAFVAARRQASMTACLVAIIIGHMIGAGIVYLVGRRWGADRVRSWLASRGEGSADETFEQLYSKYGAAALFVVRFLPYVRAVVPLIGGALRIPLALLTAVVLVHGLVWYGLITYAAWRVGENLDMLLRVLKRGGMTLGIGAAVVLAIGAAVWWWRRRIARVLALEAAKALALEAGHDAAP
jgi:membrane protein DedA with SNARE-associated domain